MISACASGLLACIPFVATLGTSGDPAVITGRVLEASTRAPLPRYLLELRSGKYFDRITTDDHGAFRTSIVFPPGDVVVRALDDDSIVRGAVQGGLELGSPDPVSLTLRFDSAPLEVLVPAGPTFQLVWKPEQPEGAPSTPATSTVELEWPDPDALTPDVQMRAGLRIESDGRAWVRFAPLITPVPKGHARLRVVAIDGVWKADADDVLADPAKPFELTWQSCARWSGVLKDGAGRGVPGIWVFLERLDDAKKVKELRRARCNGAGKYAFDTLDPGTWRLRGDPLRFRPFESEARTVAAGEKSTLGVTLDAPREMAPINGRIDGAAVVEGQPAPGDAVVVVRRAGDPLPQDTVRAVWRPDAGHWIALFVVPRLPLGEYELELVPEPDDAAAWNTLRLRAKAGGTVVFTRR